MANTIRVLTIVAALILTGNSLSAQDYPQTDRNELPGYLNSANTKDNTILIDFHKNTLYKDVYPEPQTAEDIYKLAPEDAYSLPWKPIQLSNVLWRQRVWRTIDSHETANSAFSQNIPQENKLANILVQGFFDGKYKAYSDGRFQTELTREDVIAIIANKPGVKDAGYNPEQVTKYWIKEDWMYLDTQHIVVVRIVGIAPVREIAEQDGSITDQPMFWLYYPDIRNYLSQHTVFVNGTPNNWDQLFEGRKFNSTIYKIQDLDNFSSFIKYWNDHNDTPRDITR